MEKSVGKRREDQSENGLSENKISVLKEEITEGDEGKPYESRTKEGLYGADSHGIINSSEAGNFIKRKSQSLR